MFKDNSGPAFSLEAQELNEKIDRLRKQNDDLYNQVCEYTNVISRLQNEVSSLKKQLRGARTMTEIPGGFPKKVCPETFVSNHTGPIRIAEDQMQRLLRCIVMGRIVRDIDEEEPKPEPKQSEVLNYDKDDYIRTLEAQIECLRSNLDAANDRAHMAEGRAYSLMCDYNRCKKEAELEVERLKAQVPKERACVILRPYGEYYELLMTPIIFGDRESATIWAEDRCMEVVE